MLECYFSHSWKDEDVPLNTAVWETIYKDCELYVDQTGVYQGAYYINRLERLIRRSDVFISVLPYRKREQKEDARGDYTLCCSEYALFEVRLAERARKPRWVIYDEETGFEKPEITSDLVMYTSISAKEELARGALLIREAGEKWLQQVRKVLRKPEPPAVALLVDESASDAAAVQKAVQRGLKDAKYKKIVNITTGHTDAEVVAILQASKLLVAEIGAASVGDIYAMAHALFIPSIRFMRENRGNLPWLLDGHPGGYQHDLIYVTADNDLGAEVKKRAEAMRDSRDPIRGLEEGMAYFRSRQYRDHQLIFSHNLKGEDGELFGLVFDRLKGVGVKAWEYRNKNEAGVEWRPELARQLASATDAAFILASGYELSEICMEELETILAKGSELKSITTFLWGTRQEPNPKLKKFHHQNLPANKQDAADMIVKRLVEVLRKPA